MTLQNQAIDRPNLRIKLPDVRPTLITGEQNIELANGKALKRARRQRGLTQLDLAEYMSVSQSRVSAWENGYDEIPYRHRLRLIDLLSNRRGLFDPFIGHLIRNDPYLVINGAPEFKYLHMGSRLRPKFFKPDIDIFADSPIHRPESGLRDLEFLKIARMSGREISSEIVEMDAERDIPMINNRLLRMRSHQFAVQFENYPKLIITRYEILKPGQGELPKLHHQLFLEDLDRL